MSRRVLAGLAALAVLSTSAVRAQDASSPTPPGSPSAPSAAPADHVPAGLPGHILVSTSEIHGWNGMMLIVKATATTGMTGAKLCVPVTSDAFTLQWSELVELPEDENPCGAVTPPVEFPAGDAYVSARIVRPGEREPLASVITTVTVNGETHVSLDGERLSRREHKHPAAQPPR